MNLCGTKCTQLTALTFKDYMVEILDILSKHYPFVKFVSKDEDLLLTQRWENGFHKHFIAYKDIKLTFSTSGYGPNFLFLTKGDLEPSHYYCTSFDEQYYFNKEMDITNCEMDDFLFAIKHNIKAMTRY